MYDIDFLPADYVCERTAQARNWWLRVAWVLAISSVASSGLALSRGLNQLTTHHSQLQEQTRHLMTRLGSPEQLQREWNEVECEDRLFNVLRSNIRPSRWLSAVVQALPERVALREMHAHFQESRAELPAEQVDLTVFPTNDSPEIALTERELYRVARLAERQSLVISLSGSASDDQAISRFLVALQDSHLFRRIQLLFTEQQGHDADTTRAFGIRLTVRSVLNQTEANSLSDKRERSRISSKQIKAEGRPHSSTHGRPVAGRTDARSTTPQ